MGGKKSMYSEAAYLIGILCLAAGTAFMEKANLGMSMVVAPAYLIYLKVSQIADWFTFGMAEYCFQLMLIVMCTLAVRKFKMMYLFSFCTALFYGFVLDCCMAFTNVLICDTWFLRAIFYIGGMVVCAVGVSFLFHTYIAPEAYELIVKEISEKYNKKIHKVKTIYDCVSCACAIALSFCFFGLGRFEGVKAGTVICALVNGWLIGKVSLVLERKYEFKRIKWTKQEKI